MRRREMNKWEVDEPEQWSERWEVKGVMLTVIKYYYTSYFQWNCSLWLAETLWVVYQLGLRVVIKNISEIDIVSFEKFLNFARNLEFSNFHV